jgi:hypothetical protein
MERKLTAAQQTALECLREELTNKKVFSDDDTLDHDDNTLL